MRLLVPVDHISWPLPDLAPGALLPGETILHHWPAPGGMGILTQERCLLASHPHPEHRLIVWGEGLEDVRSFGVFKGPDAWMPELFGHGFSIGGGVAVGGVGWGKLDDYYHVMVDDVRVFVGYINHCEMIQGWIDEARTARMDALGRFPLSRTRSVPSTNP
jgi:hypothetical protein